MTDFTQFIVNGRVKRGTWENIENHKIYANWLMKKLGFTDMECCYKVKKQDLEKNYGSGLIQMYYKGSPYQLLKAIYKDYEWLPWKFKQTPNGIWNVIENQIRYLEWLKIILGYENMEDWYGITQDIINKKYGSGLLQNYYNASPFQLLQAIYPNYEWLPWKFGRIKKKFWEHIVNQKQYMEWLKNILGYENMEEWYDISNEKIINNYGAGLMHYYKGSPYQLLKAIYKDYEWLPWKFKQTPIGFWNVIENQIRYLEWLKIILGYENIEDWYGITQDIINKKYGSGLLQNYYNASPFQLLQAIYPNYEWLPWKFKQPPNGFWKEIKNHKLYSEWLFKILSYENMEDWYGITNDIIINNCGSGLLVEYYRSSTQNLLKSVYPEYEWIPWKFKQTPIGFWNEIENQRKCVEWLKKELGYTTMEDWYKVTAKKIRQMNAGGLLSYYNSSPQRLLKGIYPNYEWIPWKFSMNQMCFWEEIENHKLYIEWLKTELGYTTMEDVYKITQSTIFKNYGSGLLKYYNGSPRLLIKTVYPDYPWDDSRFMKHYSQGQIDWLNSLLIPDMRHALNHPDGEFRIPNSNYYADGYSELENTIYEYHGDFWHGNPSFYNPEDIHPISRMTFGELYENTMEKKRFCEENGYRYVCIWESEWLGRTIQIIPQPPLHSTPPENAL